MTTPPALTALEVPALLRQFGLRPDKSLGQNFLVDESALVSVVQAASLTGTETVLEIGPGLGSLTRHLALGSRRLVAVELDARFMPPLKHVLDQLRPFLPPGRVTLVHNDILACNPQELIGEPGYLVVANIPYYITSALIRHLLEAPIKPARLVLTVQKEVAQRICAVPGDLSLLALSVQIYGQPVIAGHIPAGCFYPPPKVDSAIVRVDLDPIPKIPAHQLDVFFRLAKAGFSQKRKTLRNALSAGLAMPASEIETLLIAAQIDPRRRAETLSLPEWHHLVDLFPPLQR